MKKLLFATLMAGVLLTISGCSLGQSGPLSGISASGDRVVIKKVTFDTPGYLVVHESDNGKPGKILGLSILYPIGSSSNITIATADKLQSGKQYLLVMHADNSDLKFIASQDLPAQNKSGQIISATFTAR